jgi:uncharacterized protein involved in tellurium resistance
VTGADPDQAPPPGDFGFLRRRTRSGAQAGPAGAGATPGAFLVRRARRHATDTATSSSASQHDVPARADTSLDLSGPPTTVTAEPERAAPLAPEGFLRRRSRRPAQAEDTTPPREATPVSAPRGDDEPASTSLDLSEPTQATASPAPGTGTAAPGAPRSTAASEVSSRNLSDSQAPRPEDRGVPPQQERSDVRVRAQQQLVLSLTSPTVTLTRVQSGIGTLRFEAACSNEVGDLRLGCLYQLRSGRSSTVQLSDGNRFAPPKSGRPVIVGGRERYEQLSVDLRQCRELERLAVYAFSASGSRLSWGGTLVATTFGGAHVEIPLDDLSGGRVAVLLSLYNVRGEFVLRAEMETVDGSIREAARAYGYERITWLDEHTPVE